MKYKRAPRLRSEVLGAIIAGTEATANVLITVTFYLLCNPSYCEKLKVELQGAWGAGSPRIKDLLQLPYLVRSENLTPCKPSDEATDMCNTRSISVWLALF